MKDRLKAFFYSRLSHYLPYSDDEKYLYLISLVACSFITAMHLVCLIIHYAINVLPIMFLCVFALLIDILLFWFVTKRRYKIFGILLSVIVIIHAIFSAIYIGTGNLIMLYLFVTLMMQMIIPYASIRIRGMMVFVLWAAMIALVMIGYHMVPIKDIGEASNTILSLFNIHLAFFGTLIQMSIGNTIRGTIAKLNLAKLKESKHEANTDPLTGLFNRRYAEEIFRQLSNGQHEQLWCVAMLDIDDFKNVNDTYGHQVGDGVLVWLSKIISTSLRRTDFVFRWGGEEFLILLKDVDISTASYLLEKLRVKLESESFEIGNKTINITVTIGVAPLDLENIKESIEASDRLLYQGKNSGKNKVAA